jgi:hypothetical protein
VPLADVYEQNVQAHICLFGREKLTFFIVKIVAVAFIR